MLFSCFLTNFIIYISDGFWIFVLVLVGNHERTHLLAKSQGRWLHVPRSIHIQSIPINELLQELNHLHSERAAKQQMSKESVRTRRMTLEERAIQDKLSSINKGDHQNLLNDNNTW